MLPSATPALAGEVIVGGAFVASVLTTLSAWIFSAAVFAPLTASSPRSDPSNNNWPVPAVFAPVSVTVSATTSKAVAVTPA